MRYAFISDLHANLEALTKVLEAIEAMRIDTILCLGDIVGRNANPNEVLDLLRLHRVRGVRGNHDQVTIDSKYAPEKVPHTTTTIHTYDELSPENFRYLEALPITRTIDQLQLVHAALLPEPNNVVYLRAEEELRSNLEHVLQQSRGPKLVFFGHTHRVGVHRLRSSGSLVESSTAPRQRLSDDAVYLINVGSVGQARDGDARASFAIYDSASAVIEFPRVEFPKLETLAKTHRARIAKPSSAPAQQPRLERTVPRTRKTVLEVLSPSLLLASLGHPVSLDALTELQTQIAQHSRENKHTLLLCELEQIEAPSANLRAAIIALSTNTNGTAFYGTGISPALLHAIVAESFASHRPHERCPLLLFEAKSDALLWSDKRHAHLRREEQHRSR